MSNDPKDSGESQPAPGAKREYISPVLRTYGPLGGLTKAYLQGGGNKFVGSKDMTRSSQGV